MRLRKYHGLGNDFLILLDPDDRQPVDGLLARAVCDRHRGVGADGLIRVGRHLTMELYNADGGRAETSGNGLRCVARAVVDAGLAPGPQFAVQTDAGRRELTLHPNGSITVDMGIAKVEAHRSPDLRRCTLLDLGNPHVVLEVSDLEKLDVAEEVDAVNQIYPGGTNVEFVVPGPGRGELSMRVWERGVGETLACGSGACAAAFAAHGWGLVDHEVTVHQPGGDVLVELTGGTIRLTGPAEYVCDVDYPDVQPDGSAPAWP
ncbi:MAG: diaminopimelate epimerase [Acidimicrobiales bacterium]